MSPKGRRGSWKKKQESFFCTSYSYIFFLRGWNALVHSKCAMFNQCFANVHCPRGTRNQKEKEKKLDHLYAKRSYNFPGRTNLCMKKKMRYHVFIQTVISTSPRPRNKAESRVAKLHEPWCQAETHPPTYESQACLIKGFGWRRTGSLETCRPVRVFQLSGLEG